MAEMLEKCENCGQIIGKLEKAFIFNKAIVCQLCYGKLAEPEEDIYEGVDAEIDKVPQESALTRPSKKKFAGAGEIVCPNPNCGFVGKPIKKKQGSAIVMILLLFIGIIPGILYAILRGTYDYSCPWYGNRVKTNL